MKEKINNLWKLKVKKKWDSSERFILILKIIKEAHLISIFFKLLFIKFTRVCVQ